MRSIGMDGTNGADGPRWRPRVSTELLVALVSAYFVLACNGPLWDAVRAGSGSLRVLLSLGVAVFALHALLFGLFCWGRLARPLLALLLLVTALAHWYMTRYAVVFDAEMVRNVLNTDPAESRELLSLRMVLHVLLLGVLPAVHWQVRRVIVKVPCGRLWGLQRELARLRGAVAFQPDAWAQVVGEAFDRWLADLAPPEIDTPGERARQHRLRWAALRKEVVEAWRETPPDLARANRALSLYRQGW